MVPASMTYGQWYDKNVKGRPEAEQKEMLWKNRHADRKEYEKYKAIYGKDLPDSFDKFQDLKYNDSEKWEEQRLESKRKSTKWTFQIWVALLAN